MKVVLKTILAGPDGCLHPGDEVEVSEQSGKHLIATGQAEPAPGAGPVVASSPAVETVPVPDVVDVSTLEEVPGTELRETKPRKGKK